MVDLGLTSAVERNWERLLEIVTDYLDWNQTEPPDQPMAPDARTHAEPTTLFPDRPAVAMPGNEGFISRTLARIRAVLSRRGNDSGASAVTGGNATAEPDSELADEALNPEAQATRNELAPESEEEFLESDAPKVKTLEEDPRDVDVSGSEPVPVDSAPTDSGDDTADKASAEDDLRRPDDAQ